MSNKLSLQIVEECDRLVQLLREINPGLSVGNVNVETLVGTTADLRESINIIEDTNSKQISQRTQRNQRERAAKITLSALRDAVRVGYGADSAEYERAFRHDHRTVAAGSRVAAITQPQCTICSFGACAARFSSWTRWRWSPISAVTNNAPSSGPPSTPSPKWPASAVRPEGAGPGDIAGVRCSPHKPWVTSSTLVVTICLEQIPD